MNLYQINIRPFGGFLSQIKGDMLFGMFCWAVAENLGKERLQKCLEGYTQNCPFIVFSDAFPCGYLPKPALPFTYYRVNKNTEDMVKKRKEAKRRNWLSADKISLPTPEMSEHFKEVAYYTKELKTFVHLDPETHHTTGGKYSAYTLEQLTYKQNLTIYVLIDETKITVPEVQNLLSQIGQCGYGKKASSGFGKFELLGNLETAESGSGIGVSSAYLTLAPCVPQLDTFDSSCSFYHIFVRFGRHGNRAAGALYPFKKPVMTADTGAVFTFKQIPVGEKVVFIGTGITDVSRADAQTVFQGYAPVIALNVREAEYGK